MSTLRLAFRRLIGEPAFTITVLFTLALCIAANVAIFAVVDAILVRSLPLPEPSRLVTIINRYPGAGVDRAAASMANYFDRREALKSYASVSMILPEVNMLLNLVTITFPNSCFASFTTSSSI